MELLPKIYNYWRQASKLKKLLATSHYKIDEKVIFISKEDLNRGRLSGPIIEDLTDVIVIPVLALNNTSVFIPLMLEVTVDSNGCFSPAKHNTLPIIPRTVLEPGQLNPIVLGNKNIFDNYYSVCPPLWLASGYEPTWQEQLEYAMQLLSHAAQSSWQKQLVEHGYIVDEYNALIIPAQALKEDEQVQIESGLIDKIFKIDDSFVKQAQIQDITIIQAQRGSGKSKYISSIILKDWMLSALNDSLPKFYAWLKFEDIKVNRYANIFDCYPDSDVWLTAEIRQEIFSPPMCSDFSISFCVQNFLSLLSNYLHQDVIHLEQAKEILLSELRKDYALCEKGAALLKSWDDMTQVLISKYQGKGGIHARIRSLKHSVGIVQQELRHLSGLSAIWERLLESARQYPSWFDSIRLLNYLKNRKLYKFYAQYFPDDKVSMLSPQGMNAKMCGRIAGLKNKEHLLNDTLHQSSNDLLQLDAVRIKCKNWFNNFYKYPIGEYQQAFDFLNIEVVKKLNFLTLKYYESLVIDNFAWSKNNNKYTKYFIDGQVSEIDVLCVEHANYVSILDALPLLNRSCQAIIFGDNNSINSDFYPLALDLELCDFNALVKDALDFEYLKAKGILGAVNNLWQFVTKALHTNQVFEKNHYIKPIIEYVNVPASRQEHLGSKYNSKEVDAVYNFLLDIHNKSASWDDIVIYTAFAGQARKVSLRLKDTIFANLPIKLLQQPNLRRNTISIVAISVTHSDDSLHIANMKFIDNIISNTCEKLVIICNEGQFKDVVFEHATASTAIC